MSAATRRYQARQFRRNFDPEFEIDLPLAVIKRLLHEVVILEKAQVKNKVIVVDRGKIRGSSLNGRIAEVKRGQALLVTRWFRMPTSSFRSSGARRSVRSRSSTTSTAFRREFSPPP